MARRSRRAALALLCVVSLGPEAAWAAQGRGADGHFEKRTSSHVVLYQGVDSDRSSGLRGSRRFEQLLLQTLESAYGGVADVLGIRPRRAISVVVYDPAVFDAQYRGLFRFPSAGFYGGTVHIRGDVQLHQQLVRVLNHEYVHAAIDAEAPSLVLPAWLNEGLAEWFEARSVGKHLLSPGEHAALVAMGRNRGFFSLAQLSTPSFGHLGPGQAGRAYLQSYAFIEFLAREHGERRLREFCGDLLRTGNLARSLQRAFRADLARLEQRFQAGFR